MKKTVTYFVLFMGMFLLTVPLSGAEPRPPAVGGVLPQFTLPVPQNSDHQQYLGVTGKHSFTIPEIKADVVIIEIFSMY